MFSLPRRYSSNLTLLILLVEVFGILSTSEATAQSKSKSPHQVQHQKSAYNLKKHSSNSQSSNAASNSASRAVKTEDRRTTVDGDELVEGIDYEVPVFLEEGASAGACDEDEEPDAGTGCTYDPKLEYCWCCDGVKGECCKKTGETEDYYKCRDKVTGKCPDAGYDLLQQKKFQAAACGFCVTHCDYQRQTTDSNHPYDYIGFEDNSKNCADKPDGKKFPNVDSDVEKQVLPCMDHCLREVKLDLEYLKKHEGKCPMVE